MPPGTGVLRRRLRQACFVAIGGLYVASVPWYRNAETPPEIVAGLPDWVAVALACYVAAGAINALAWWLSEVPDDHGSSPEAGP